MKKESLSLVSFVALAVFAGLLVSNIASTYAEKQVTQYAVTSSPSANSNNVTLGTPQFSEATHDKVTTSKPALVNGTHGILLSFIGRGILGGVNATDTGTAFVTNGTGGYQYQIGHGEYTSPSGGVAPFTFQGVIHSGESIGTQFNTKASGNLLFAGNAAGIFKVEMNNGKISGMVWFWK